MKYLLIIIGITYNNGFENSYSSFESAFGPYDLEVCEQRLESAQSQYAISGDLDKYDVIYTCRHVEAK